MSISTTYQIISKNETYSLSWPTHLVFDETVANEEPIVGILTLTLKLICLMKREILQVFQL